MEKKMGGGGRKLTIVLCEAQGGCYTLHLLCCKKFVVSLF